MAGTYIVRDPITGDYEYDIRTCPGCKGKGEKEWHLGCGDMGPPTCTKCDGLGEVFKRCRPVLADKTRGPWQHYPPE
jgi:DnaJ-class molecular chaperone